jgi:hypothetical protein
MYLQRIGTSFDNEQEVSSNVFVCRPEAAFDHRVTIMKPICIPIMAMVTVAETQSTIKILTENFTQELITQTAVDGAPVILNIRFERPHSTFQHNVTVLQPSIGTAVQSLIPTSGMRRTGEVMQTTDIQLTEQRPYDRQSEQTTVVNAQALIVAEKPEAKAGHDTTCHYNEKVRTIKKTHFFCFCVVMINLLKNHLSAQCFICALFLGSNT